MIWVTWRQHRGEALVVGVVLAALAAALLITGMQMAGAYQSLGVGPCLAPTNTNPHCGDIFEAFREQFGVLESASGWLNFMPALVGMLIAVPLVARELEQRTYLLAWTQGVTRRRWLTIKLSLIFVATLLVAGALTALMTWWRGPFDALGGRLSPIGFDFEGIVPFAYMAFVVALGVAAGALVRRVIPAMVVTLAGFTAVRLALETWARPYLYQAPVTLNVDPLASAGAGRADWTLDFGFVDHAGQSLSSRQVYNTCTGPGVPSKIGVFQCIQAHNWLVSYVFQPANRFWRFQLTEAAIYLALTLALLAFTFWWVRRRTV